MMDDLISRKALKQAIDHDFYEHYTKYHDTDQRALIDMVMDDIDEMPVAFDKEKVMEELHDAADLSVEDGLWHVELREALGIVEKGGIE